MKLYYWTSKALREYANGHLITIANDIEEAKENIRTQFLRDFQETFLHLDFHDPDDQDMIREKLEELENDLSKEPVHLNHDGNCILIKGSS